MEELQFNCGTLADIGFVLFAAGLGTAEAAGV
jgi:hypothetical protein